MTDQTEEGVETSQTEAELSSAPAKAEIDRSLLTPFEAYDYLVIEQTRKGCCQEWCGCEANNEFIFEDKKKNKVMYSLEESSCMCRYCCANCRKSKGNITLYDKSSRKDSLVEYERPLRCMPTPCCCCCNQLMNFQDGNGAHLGHASVPCYLFNPVIVVYDENAHAIYKIHQPTCCGCFINCWAAGCCSCKTPFHVYPTSFKKKEDHGDKHIGKISKLLGGILDRPELIKSGDEFEVEFPPAAQADDKARLALTTLFINMLFYEAKRNGCCCCGC